MESGARHTDEIKLRCDGFSATMKGPNPCLLSVKTFRLSKILPLGPASTPPCFLTAFLHQNPSGGEGETGQRQVVEAAFHITRPEVSFCDHETEALLGTPVSISAFLTHGVVIYVSKGNVWVVSAERHTLFAHQSLSSKLDMALEQNIG